MRFLALTVFVVPIHIPVRAAGVEIPSNVVGDIRDHELGTRNGIGLEVLKIVMDEHALHAGRFLLTNRTQPCGVGNESVIPAQDEYPCLSTEKAGSDIVESCVFLYNQYGVMYTRQRACPRIRGTLVFYFVPRLRRFCR